MVTNLPPVEGREQLSAVTNLVMMSGSQKDEAFVCLRKIVQISEEQEEAIKLSIKRVYTSMQRSILTEEEREAWWSEK